MKGQSTNPSAPPQKLRHRAFISYSHGDEREFLAVRTMLGRLGFEDSSDRRLSAGSGFTEQIRMLITHSHVFVPILTPQSHKRGWVHQEIGFSVAMRIPVVPVCIGSLPEGMIKMNQAVVVRRTGSDLEAKLRNVNFNSLIEESGKGGFPQISCALRPEERAKMIEESADDARRCIGAQFIRYSAGLTSFSLPDESPEHDSWTARYADAPRSRFAFEWFRRERQALEKHARKAGCRLLIHTGFDADKDYGPGAQHTRLRILTDFLESVNGKVEAFVSKQVNKSSVLFVGDWMLAESHALRPVLGIQHTSFTAHAPAIQRRLEEFDGDFLQQLHEAGIDPLDSRRVAIRKLKALLKSAPPHPLWPRKQTAKRKRADR